MSSVQLRNVAKRYGSVTAVAGISLDIAHGEFLALLGPSGCGKTTTLQMLAGFVEPTSGDIRVDETSIAGVPPHRRNIGVVFQSYALFPHLTVYDNVAFGLRMRSIDKATIREGVGRALDIVQLTGLDGRHPRNLSGGQQQRVALARALVIEPSVLLLDEPLSNLDANLLEQMRFEIREIQKRIGITTVFVTHDQSEAIAAADRLVVMKGGHVRQVGTAREIYGSPADLFVASFIGQSNLLPGRVAEVRGAEALVQLGEGAPVVAPNRPGLGPGEPARLLLRPEDLGVSASSQAGRNNLPGIVSRSSYLGSSQKVTIAAAGQEIHVDLPCSDAPEVGQPVFLHWRPDASALFREGEA